MSDGNNELSGSDFAEALAKLNEGEKHASQLEKMLDSIEAKMDAILKQAEEINKGSNGGNNADDSGETDAGSST
ncbi:hypothetical protein WICMUC_000180 [Wickerhamomyces mucosus]|uniref:Uncharacterized protein n=1 Tax=Wickerhamomyces mucosus TaxID=1378264 RepID=A0A9P8TJ52_9ASCO|nr:hypothetical protein WICMUC_000180 [Wickerhamomyces mucosus]